MKREVRKKNTVDKIPARFSAAEPAVGPGVELLTSPAKKYCVIQEKSLNDLEDKYKLETGSVFTEVVNVVLADSQYSSCSANGQLDSGRDVF